MSDHDVSSNLPKAADAEVASSRPALPAPRLRRKSVAIALGLIVLLAAALAGYVKYEGGLGNAIVPFIPAPDLVHVFGKANLRVLVLGLDEDWTENDQAYTRTDTLIAVNLDLANKQVNLLSIPRDLWVSIPKSGYGKINEAYGDGGPLRAEATVVKNLGTPAFDYYVTLSLDATKNIIDALGGIDVAVEKDMDYDDSWGHLHIHLKRVSAT